MARVEDDSSESDEKLSVDGDAEDANLDVVKDDSDDESITSEDEDEFVLEEKVTAIQEKIFENPYVYKNHIDLLSILQQLGNRSRLRSVYERLSDLYPLDSKQWLSWLQMEVASVTSTEGRDQIYKLFDNAFLDCYSTSIYMEWCAMSMGGGKEEARTIIPQALKASGSDPMDGAMLWDTAKEFEFAHLSVLNSASALSSAEYAMQVMRVFEVFQNQLSRPLFTSEKTMEEFRTFADSMKAYIPDVEDKVKKVEEAHITSEKILKDLMDFENELELSAESEAEEIKEKCNVYKRYISHVKGLMGDYPIEFHLPSLVMVLYDRATSDCAAAMCRLDPTPSPDCDDLCEAYVEFAREHSTDEQCLKVIEKVIKRCPRNHSLWMTKLHHIERMGHDLEKIKSEFETALYCGFHSAPDYVTIWLCYLEALRRKTDFSCAEEIDRLRKTFRLSWDNLGQMWGDTADTEFIILQFWARIEYQHTKDYEYGKELFDEIFEYGDNRLRGGLWLEFIALEKLRGGTARARAGLRRALRNCADPRLQRAWLALERDHGTLDTLIECNKTCEAKAKEWEEVQAANRSKDGPNNYKNKNQQNRFQNQNQQNNVSTAKGKKNKRNKSTGDQFGQEKSPGKKKNNQKSNEAEEFKQPLNKGSGKKRKMDSENCDDDPTKSSKLHKENNSDISYQPTGTNAKRKNETNDTPSKRLRPDDTEEASSAPPPGYEAFKKQSEMVEDEEKNIKTAFVSNLDFRVDETELRTKLSEYGEIEEMRLIKGVKTFGSICYCVYKDADSVAVALSHDRALLGTRPMFISRYCSTKDSREKHFVYPTGIERNKLFVKNIAFDYCTEKRLTDVFAKFGDLKGIRIVSYKNGNPKGLAYVEYVEEKSANAALHGTDGISVGGRPICVALSAPPPKKTEPHLLRASASSHMLTPPSTRNHSRTMMFVPRVLQKPSANVASKPNQASDCPAIHVASVANGDTLQADQSSKLSNSDFRNMLLSKK